MHKFLSKVGLFFLLFILVNAVYLVTIEKVDWNYAKRIESLRLINPKYDVLVLGNSLAMDGIDTKYLTDNGFASYNTALGGASLKTNLIQLKEYLSRYKYKPGFVILGLGSYLNNFESEGINPIVEYTMSAKKQYTFSDIPMIKFKWLFKEQLKKLVSKAHRDAYVINGQLRFSKAVPDNTAKTDEMNFPLDEYTSSSILKSIIEVCNNHGLVLIIIELPGFKKTRHELHNPCYTIDKEHNNGFLFDFNYHDFGCIFNENDDWIGNSHLNEKGARKFTLHLLSLLNDLNMGKNLCN